MSSQCWGQMQVPGTYSVSMTILQVMMCSGQAILVLLFFRLLQHTVLQHLGLQEQAASKSGCHACCTA